MGLVSLPGSLGGDTQNSTLALSPGSILAVTKFNKFIEFIEFLLNILLLLNRVSLCIGQSDYFTSSQLSCLGCRSVQLDRTSLYSVGLGAMLASAHSRCKHQNGITLEALNSLGIDTRMGIDIT